MNCCLFEDIRILYEKHKHIRIHTDFAIQMRAWLLGKYDRYDGLTIWNEGKDSDYSYLAKTDFGAWRVFTHRTDIADDVFFNVIDRVDTLTIQSFSGNRRYFS